MLLTRTRKRVATVTATALTLGLLLAPTLSMSPALADDSTNEELGTTTELAEPGPQTRAIGPAKVSRVFSGVPAQFGAGSALVLPGAEGLPPRAVVTSSYTGTAPIVDLPSGKAPVTAVTGLNGTHGVAAASGATSAGGRLFFVSVFSNSVGVYDIASRNWVDEISIPGAQPASVTFVGNPEGTEGTLFVGATSESSIYGVDVATGDTVMEARVPWGGWIGGLAPGADATARSGSLLVVDAGLKGEVLRIDIASGAITETHKLPAAGSPDSARNIAVIPGSAAGEEHVLVTNQETGKILRFDLANDRALTEFAYGPAKPWPYSDLGMSAVAYLPGEQNGQGTVFGFMPSGGVVAFNETTADVEYVTDSLGYVTGGIGFRAVSPGSSDGEVFVADRLSRNMKVYDTASDSLAREITLSGKDFPKVAVSGGGSEYLIVGYAEGPVEIRDPDSGDVQHTFTMRADSLGSSPDSNLIFVSEEAASSFTLLDASTGKTVGVHTLPYAPGAVTLADYAGRSSYFIPDRSGGRIEVRSVDTFEVLASFTGFSAPVQASVAGGTLSVLERRGVLHDVALEDGTVLRSVRTGFNGAGVVSGTDLVDGGSWVYTADSTMGIAFTRVSGLSLAPDALPDGLVGDAYSAEVDAFGTPAPTLALTGDLPDGLSFDTASGEITGTPTHAGTFEFTVTAANGVDRDQSRTYTVVIGALPHITTDSLPNSTVDDKYRHSVDTDGYPDPSLSVSDGELPPGLSLDAASGVLSGTATKAGEYSFSLTATNDFGADTKQYTISVAAAPVPPTVTPPGTKPPVTEPPTTEPPVTQPPAAEGNGDEKSEQLPETGAAGLWSLGAVALALCAGGAVLALRPSRRRVKG
ncbi:hypothetical protein GCM10009693_09650 [Leucobacter chromiireducens subsp. chromiireducens]|uniref:Uncharacterized protein n=1 Tax=Leucobacter chromiireducens subsp. chromiireducens TaxID=660067 RepID=A0ABS1SN12_9MICO|nr:hypothetical protein [Leucobacter chromiireducens subsp. chromiireducens]